MSATLGERQSYASTSALASWAAAILTANKNNCKNNKSNATAPATLASRGNGRLSLKLVAIGPHKTKHTPLLAQLLSCLGTDTCPPASFTLPVAALGQHHSNIFLLKRRKKGQGGWSTHVTESSSHYFSETPLIFAAWALCSHVIPCSHEIKTLKGSSGPGVRM